MTLTRDYAALMAAIIADPDDDLPRLAFADHCEEIGEVERGELVRVQLEIAAKDNVLCHQPGAVLGDGCDDTFCPRCGNEGKLAWRERQLLESHGEEWCEWLADSFGFKRDALFWGHEGGTAGRSWLWRRGFIEEIHAPMADWLRCSPEWLQQTPLRVYKPLKLPGERLDRPNLFNDTIWLWQCENVGRLHTIDLTSIMAGSSSSHHWYGTFTATSRYAYRPWRGLQRVIVPHQSSGMEVQCGWWQERIPGIEVVFAKQGGEPS